MDTPTHYAGVLLQALRTKIGLRQFELAHYLHVHTTTVKNIERKGTTNAQYVADLLKLVDERLQKPIPTLRRRGRAAKQWRLSRQANPDKAKFLLYMELEKDDLRPLVGRPAQGNDTVVWLERDNLDTRLWRKMSIDSSGLITQWTVVRY